MIFSCGQTCGRWAMFRGICGRDGGGSGAREGGQTIIRRKRIIYDFSAECNGNFSGNCRRGFAGQCGGGLLVSAVGTLRNAGRGASGTPPPTRALRLPVVAARIARHVRLRRTAFRRNANHVPTSQDRLLTQTVHPSDVWRPMAAATGRLTGRAGRRGRRPLRGHYGFLM